MKGGGEHTLELRSLEEDNKKNRRGSTYKSVIAIVWGAALINDVAKSYMYIHIFYVIETNQI